MNKRIKSFTLRIEAEQLEKFRYIAASQMRSISGQINAYIRKCIKLYEAEYGEIPIDTGY